MAQHKAPPDSIRTSHTQKPFVRLDDIGDAGIIVAIISGVFFIGSFIAIITLFEDPNHPPPGVLLFIAGVPSVGIWVASYALLRRKYALPWSAIGLTSERWQQGLLWALVLFPLALFACWLEDHGWRWLLYQYSIPFLRSWQSPLELISLLRELHYYHAL